MRDYKFNYMELQNITSYIPSNIYIIFITFNVKNQKGLRRNTHQVVIDTPDDM